MLFILRLIQVMELYILSIWRTRFSSPIFPQDWDDWIDDSEVTVVCNEGNSWLDWRLSILKFKRNEIQWEQGTLKRFCSGRLYETKQYLDKPYCQNKILIKNTKIQDKQNSNLKWTKGTENKQSEDLRIRGWSLSY